MSLFKANKRARSKLISFPNKSSASSSAEIDSSKFNREPATLLTWSKLRPNFWASKIVLVNSPTFPLKLTNINLLVFWISLRVLAPLASNLFSLAKAATWSYTISTPLLDSMLFAANNPWSCWASSTCNPKFLVKIIWVSIWSLVATPIKLVAVDTWLKASTIFSVVAYIVSKDPFKLVKFLYTPAAFSLLILKLLAIFVILLSAANIASLINLNSSTAPAINAPIHPPPLKKLLTPCPIDLKPALKPDIKTLDCLLIAWKFLRAEAAAAPDWFLAASVNPSCWIFSFVNPFPFSNSSLVNVLIVLLISAFLALSKTVCLDALAANSNGLENCLNPGISFITSDILEKNIVDEFSLVASSTISPNISANCLALSLNSAVFCAWDFKFDLVLPDDSSALS